jgi:hypothetical protein
MGSLKKLLISLLVGMFVTGVFLIAGFSGLFESIETTFYNTRVLERVDQDLDQVNSVFTEYENSLVSRMQTILSSDAFRRTFEVNQTSEDIVEAHLTAIDELNRDFPAFVSLRIVDADFINLVYSSRINDIERRDNLLRRIFYFPVEDLDFPVDVAGNIERIDEQDRGDWIRLISGEFQLLVYLFPVYNNFDIFSGYAIAVFDSSSLTNQLIREQVVAYGEEIALFPENGLLVNPPQVPDNVIRILQERWSVLGDSEILTFELEGTGEVRAQLGFSEQITSVFLIPISELQLNRGMIVFLTSLLFFTAFLLIFLISNIRQDSEVVVRDRLKRFQLDLLSEAVDQRGNLDVKKWTGDYRARQKEIKQKITAGIPAKDKKAYEELVDSSWEEILEILGSSRMTNQISNAKVDFDVNQLQQLIDNLYARLAHAPINPNAIAAPSSASVSQSAPVPVQDFESLEPADVAEMEELDELDAEEVGELGSPEPVEAEELEDLDELDAEEVGELGSPEPVEAEELEDLDELDAEEVGELGSPEPVEAEELEDLDELDAEEVGELGSLEPEEAEEVEDLDELAADEFEELGSPEPVEAEELEDLDELDAEEVGELGSPESVEAEELEDLVELDAEEVGNLDEPAAEVIPELVDLEAAEGDGHKESESLDINDFNKSEVPEVSAELSPLAYALETDELSGFESEMDEILATPTDLLPDEAAIEETELDGIFSEEQFDDATPEATSEQPVTRDSAAEAQGDIEQFLNVEEADLNDAWDIESEIQDIQLDLPDIAEFDLDMNPRQAVNALDSMQDEVTNPPVDIAPVAMSALTGISGLSPGGYRFIGSSIDNAISSIESAIEVEILEDDDIDASDLIDDLEELSDLEDLNEFSYDGSGPANEAGSVSVTEMLDEIPVAEVEELTEDDQAYHPGISEYSIPMAELFSQVAEYRKDHPDVIVEKNGMPSISDQVYERSSNRPRRNDDDLTELVQQVKDSHEAEDSPDSDSSGIHDFFDGGDLDLDDILDDREEKASDSGGEGKHFYAEAASFGKPRLSEFGVLYDSFESGYAAKRGGQLRAIMNFSRGIDAISIAMVVPDGSDLNISTSIGYSIDNFESRGETDRKFFDDVMNKLQVRYFPPARLDDLLPVFSILADRVEGILVLPARHRDGAAAMVIGLHHPVKNIAEFCSEMFDI